MHQDFNHFTSVIDVKNTKLYYAPEGMTEDEIKNLISLAYKKFYLRPSYLFKPIVSIRSFSDVRKYLKAFKTIIKV